MGSPLIDALLKRLEASLVGNTASRVAQGRSSPATLKPQLQRGLNPGRRGFDFAPPFVPPLGLAGAFLALIRANGGAGADANRVYLRGKTTTQELIQPSDGRTRLFAAFGRLAWGDRRLALGSKDNVSPNLLLAEVVNLLTPGRTLPLGVSIPWSQHAQFTHVSTDPGATPPTVTLPAPEIPIMPSNGGYLISAEVATVPDAGINGPGGPGFLSVLVSSSVGGIESDGPLALTPPGVWSIRAFMNVDCGTGLPPGDVPCPDQSVGAQNLFGVKVTANPAFPATSCKPFLLLTGILSITSPCGPPCQVPPQTFPQCAQWLGGAGPLDDGSITTLISSTFDTIGLDYHEASDETVWLLKQTMQISYRKTIKYTGSWNVQSAGRAGCCFSGVVCAGQGWCEAGYAAWYGVAPPFVCGTCSIIGRTNTLGVTGFGRNCANWTMTLTGLKIIKSGVVTRNDLAGVSVVDGGGGLPALSPAATTASITTVRTGGCTALSGTTGRSVQPGGYGKAGGGFAVAATDGPDLKIVTDLGVGGLLPSGYDQQGIGRAGPRLWLHGNSSGGEEGPRVVAGHYSAALDGTDVQDWTGVVIPETSECDQVYVFDALKELPGKGAVIVGHHLKFVAPGCAVFDTTTREGRAYQFNQPAVPKTITLHALDATRALDLVNDPAWIQTLMEAGISRPQYRWRIIGL